jgi:hypothetical protein
LFCRLNINGDSLQDRMDNLLFLDEFIFCLCHALTSSENETNGYQLVVDKDNEYIRLAFSNFNGKLKWIITCTLVLNLSSH